MRIFVVAVLSIAIGLVARPAFDKLLYANLPPWIVEWLPQYFRDNFQPISVTATGYLTTNGFALEQTDPLYQEGVNQLFAPGDPVTVTMTLSRAEGQFVEVGSAFIPDAQLFYSIRLGEGGTQTQATSGAITGSSVSTDSISYSSEFNGTPSWGQAGDAYGYIELMSAGLKSDRPGADDIDAYYKLRRFLARGDQKAFGSFEFRYCDDSLLDTPPPSEAEDIDCPSFTPRVFGLPYTTFLTFEAAAQE